MKKKKPEPKKSKPTSLDLKQIGERLLKARKTLKKTLQHMGDISGLSKSIISDAEKGAKKPSATYLHALLKHYNININYILSGSGDMFLDGRQASAEDKDINELFQIMKKSKILRYAVLAFYYQYANKNQDIIEKLTDEPGIPGI